MRKKENYELPPQEEIVPLDKEDEPLSSEQVADLEGSLDEEEPLELPDFSVVQKELRENGLEATGDREPCSGGVFGPIFKIRVRDMESGEEKYVIERTFTEVEEMERRFSLIGESSDASLVDSEPRYKIVDRSDQKQNKLVIDYLYNEEKALKALASVPGVPRFYGAAYDDLKGSILEEYVDGYDLSVVLAQDKPENVKEIEEILEKVKAVYMEAARLGYIHNDPVESTIMVDQKGMPRLADWYLYSHGSIDSDPEIKMQYLKGLESIAALQKRLTKVAA